MFRRPLATVFSSVSIINLRLSTRLFCAPATSNDEKITFVQTTGNRWKSELGIECARNGVYWGEGDPRNKEVQRNFDTTDIRYTKLQSVLMALEQAKEDGLKRILVQTDSEMNELTIRTAAKMFENLDPEEREEPQFSVMAYCEKIAKIMNQMEVVLEYKNHKRSVRELLKKDRINQSSLDIDFTSPEHDALRIVTPEGASPLEGRTVPTVYTAGRFHIGCKIGANASLWLPESIEHLNIKPKSYSYAQRHFVGRVVAPSLAQSKKLAILNAIEEAQTLNIPEILVITDDLHFIQFFKWGWKKQDGSSIPNENLYRQIKKLTETIKVHFQGVRFVEDCEDITMKKVQEMAQKKLDQYATNPSSNGSTNNPRDASALSVPTLSAQEIVVRTTGIRLKQDGTICAVNGVYWGAGDPRNMKVKMSDDFTDSEGVKVRSIMMALEQAKEDGLKRIRVQTDYDLDKADIRTAADIFKSLDMDSKKKLHFTKFAHCERIAKIMDEMEVIFEYREPTFGQKDNYVIELLNADKK